MIWRIVLGGAVVLAATSLGIWSTRPKVTPEPTYRGRTLGDWLDDRISMPGGQVVLTDEAEAAVRAIGTAAIPTLLGWLRTPDSSFSRNANGMLQGHLGLPLRVPSSRDRWRRALYGLRALGPDARVAQPALVAIALGAPDPCPGPSPRPRSRCPRRRSQGPRCRHRGDPADSGA